MKETEESLHSVIAAMRSREEEQIKLIADLRSDILRSTALDAAFASGLSSVDGLQAEGGGAAGAAWRSVTARVSTPGRCYPDALDAHRLLPRSWQQGRAGARGQGQRLWMCMRQ